MDYIRRSRNTRQIFSGSFEVSKDKNVVLEAMLGTCVGVAAYDSVNKTGGLLHILLPEPFSKACLQTPEKYASTALPMFLKELKEKGANFENIEITVAGGALVGPVSHQDIVLNIGGRSLEIVKFILSNHGIKVSKSETGGFFSCNLRLHMDDGISEIVPKSFYDLPETQDTEPVKDINIEDIYDKIQPIPQTALKILNLANEGIYSTDSIVNEVKKDQVIAAKIIKLCNSSFFSIKREIYSLNDAVAIIGLDTLIKLIISDSVTKYYKQSSSGYSLCMGGLFHHAVGTSIIAEGIARMTELVSPGIAYTAGMLHDFGLVVLDQYFNQTKPLFYRELEMSSTICDVEKKVFGVNHVETGKKIARSWNFPEPLIDVISYHHTPEKAHRNRELVNIIYIADFIMERFSRGIFADNDSNSLEFCLNSLKLSLDSIPEIVNMIPSKTGNQLM